MADAKNKAAETATEKTEAKAPDLSAHKKALEKLDLKRTPDKRPLTPVQMAKIRFQRLKLAAKRGGSAAVAKAITLNAKDLGIDAKVYASEFKHEMEAAGL